MKKRGDEGGGNLQKSASCQFNSKKGLRVKMGLIFRHYDYSGVQSWRFSTQSIEERLAEDIQNYQEFRIIQ